MEPIGGARDEKPFVEVQDADLGISYRFDSAKFTSEKAKEWVQKRTHKDCPVMHKDARSWLHDGSSTTLQTIWR